MKALPRPLSPWAAALAGLSAESQGTFGPWLATLERLLEAQTPPWTAESGVPDGLSGLGRRGRYERLALSEWGLLDTMPEEFLRRAGSSEHLFHQIARAARPSGRRVVVLFDAGPLQLGAPRLVHLAWLLVLERHALRTGARLQWGTLQLPGMGLRDTEGPATLRALLATRTLEPVHDGVPAAWVERLGPPADGEERWLVSAARAPALETALAAATLAVSEPEQPDVNELRVTVVHPGGTRSQARLMLPPPRVCAGVLRNPFPRAERAPASSERVADGAQLLFSASGTHLLARLASGVLVGIPLPRKRTDPQAPALRLSLSEGHEAVAVGWRKGKLFAASVRGGAVTIWVVSRDRTDTRNREVKGDAAVPLASRTLLCPLVVDGKSGAIWFGDAAWRLYHGFLEGGYLFAAPESVLAWSWVGDRLASIGRVGSGPLELFLHQRQRLDRVVLDEGASRSSQGYVCFDPHKQPALAAVATSAQSWRTYQPEKGLLASMQPRGEINFPGDMAVFGAAMHASKPCLLVRTAPDRLELTSATGPYLQFNFPGPVEHACLHPQRNLVAAQVEGRIVVVNEAGQTILQWGGDT